jgi:caa(3)-type oxidase subunit IV
MAPQRRHEEASYGKYWLAWLALLLITVTMVFIGSAPILIAGMTVKALIIALWFMHLRYERLELVLCVVIGIFATALLLYLVMVPDGNEMNRSRVAKSSRTDVQSVRVLFEFSRAR